MKFNIEVEVDWIGEEGSIDEVIKNEISATVVNTITKKIEKEMEEKATAAISGKVDDMCNSLIGEFLKRKVTVTDRWGDAIIRDTTIEEMLKKKFDEFWNAKVDDQGREGNSGYSTKHVRFEWAIDKQIKSHAESFAKTLTNDTANKIKENMTEQLRNAIGAKLVGELGFDKLLLAKKD